MKVGILIHSYTGNTYSVAEKIKDKLVKEGHSVDLKKLEPVGGENVNEIDISKITFDPLPEVSGYDVIILGAPVRAFSMSPVLSAYLRNIPSLKEQKVELFVTQSLPHSWMGGKHAISQMKKLCLAKGAKVVKTGIINWKNKKREAILQEVVEELGKL